MHFAGVFKYGVFFFFIFEQDHIITVFVFSAVFLIYLVGLGFTGQVLPILLRKCLLTDASLMQVILDFKWLI